MMISFDELNEKENLEYLTTRYHQGTLGLTRLSTGFVVLSTRTFQPIGVFHEEDLPSPLIIALREAQRIPLPSPPTPTLTQTDLDDLSDLKIDL